MRTCTTDGCDRKHEGRGLCKMHWRREYGKPTRFTIQCTICGLEHQSARPSGKYCSDQCKAFAYTSPVCTVPTSHPSRRTLPVPSPTYTGDCAWCGSTFVSPMPHAAHCSKRCRQKRGKRVRRARQHGVGGSYSWGQVMRLFTLFGRCCAYCTKPIDGLPDPDHVVPLSKGGHNGIGNILPCCHACNSGKRDMLLTEWQADRARRGLTPIVTTWSVTDPRYQHLHAGLHQAA